MFQFYLSSIKCKEQMSEYVEQSKSSFNSTLVQLKVIYFTFTSVFSSSFNSTLVQLKGRDF